MKPASLAALVGAALVALSTMVLAQATKQPDRSADPAANQAASRPGAADRPQNGGQAQPQGPTGPIDTNSGGTPAASPQGDTPAGMQAAPEGSAGHTVRDPTGR
jgi:hypothetical protein